VLDTARFLSGLGRDDIEEMVRMSSLLRSERLVGEVDGVESVPEKSSSSASSSCDGAGAFWALREARIS